MNIITIDPSLSCTAMCINGKFFVYATSSVAHTPSGKYRKWFSVMEQYVEYRVFDSIDRTLPYSASEVAKIKLYDHITDVIISDIALNLNEDDPDTLICIEGYSYSSNSSAIIDLVTYSTLLRSKLLLDIESHLMVISPSTLKVRSCEFTYGDRFNSKGKKLASANTKGVTGGRFKKPEMMEALVSNDTLGSDWYVNVLRNECPELVNGSIAVPKPIEDMNDAKLMYEIIFSIASGSDYNVQSIESKLLK